jgi:transformation/transcription domain-associated protein
MIALRHILSTDFRAAFVAYIETLLDENVLIGSGRTSFETLRCVGPMRGP